MSRIHEALKRAAQNHGPLPVPEAATVPSAADPLNLNARHEDVRSASNDWLNLSLLPAGEPSSPSAAPFSNGLNDVWKNCAKRGWKFDPAYSCFPNNKPSGECAEQFRKLRARLYQMRANESLHTIMVTSTVPAEGKTFVALNLALAITRQHNRRVLLIDADLRAPKLASCLGVPSTPGLSEFLSGTADDSSIVQADMEGGLFFIPGGHVAGNPTEMLGSERLSWLLARMAPLFDWVIMDTPPVLPVSDASILASHCDGVVMVVKAGSTGYDAVGSALQELQGKKLLGVVLNRVERRDSYDAYPYYAADKAEQA